MFYAKHLPALMLLFYTKRRRARGIRLSVHSLYALGGNGCFFILLTSPQSAICYISKARKTLSIFIAINQQHISFRKFYIRPINLFYFFPDTTSEDMCRFKMYGDVLCFLLAGDPHRTRHFCT
jgi:hypothetical protein